MIPANTNVLSTPPPKQQSKDSLLKTMPVHCPSLFSSPKNRTPHSAKKRLFFQSPPAKKGCHRALQFDRFIPNRSATKQENEFLTADATEVKDVSLKSSQLNYEKQLALALLKSPASSKVFSFTDRTIDTSPSHANQIQVNYSAKKGTTPSKRRRLRYISANSERILDAPNLVPDFYLNLLHWGAKNQLAVGLGRSLYLWNAITESTEELLRVGRENIVTSVKWNGAGDLLAVGDQNGQVQIWDIEAQKKIRVIRAHNLRVTALAWNGSTLTSGGKDTFILNFDIRSNSSNSSNVFSYHQQEVCGLEWDQSCSLLASGGNDNKCCIWQMGTQQPLHVFSQSSAAVKALAWCPWMSQLFATGSGTADRHLRFYCCKTGELLQELDTKSQVCSLEWSQREKEIVSAHGFSENQLTVWKYPSLTKITDLKGHTARVLHTTQSPDGSTICSASADETLRFWKVWDCPEEAALQSATPIKRKASFLDVAIR